MSKDNIIIEKTFDFALNIIDLYKYLTDRNGKFLIFNYEFLIEY